MSELDAESLRLVYCPPIDDAVFYALASDYHGSELIDLLDKLKAAALEEEKTAFDPSATGGAFQQEADFAGWPRTTPEDTSASNGLTSLTSDIGDLRLQEDGTDINQLELEDQVKFLHGLFPSLSLDRIRNVCITLSSSDQAIEELLNLSFLADEGDIIDNQEPAPKGVEWFAEEFRSSTRKKGRRRRWNDSSRTSSVDASSPAAPSTAGSAASQNVWKSVTCDVDFICSKTTLQPQTVRSTYHTHGANLPLTIRTFADNEGAKWNKLAKVDEILEQQIAEIKPLFQNVSDAQIFGLLRLTRYMPSAVHELLTVMTAPAQEERELPRNITNIVVQHALPLSLASTEDPLATTMTAAPLPPPKPRPHPSIPLHDDKEWMKVTPRNTRYTAVTSHDDGVSIAFDQASQAYRKSKSNPLYGGAAAYYSQVGHERLRKAKVASAAEADMMAHSQSRATTLDLHGIDVPNAVRIAQRKTQQWWDSLGDSKYGPGGGTGSASARTGGFRIITGLGTHSKNHTPQIGPALTKRLVNEGWKVEILHGEILVTGKRKKR